MNRWFCSLAPRSAVTERLAALCLLLFLFALYPERAHAAHQAPDWLHQAALKASPKYDEQTDAVLVYSETTVTVVSKDKIRTHVRQAYKILRPNGREHGRFYVYTYGRKKVTFMRGWCIPQKGQDYEVTEKDAIEQSPSLAPGFSLVSDARRKFMQIPAADPGNIIGYEYEIEEQPFFLQDEWEVQQFDPVMESHYRLQLPEGWEFKASWAHRAAVEPAQTGHNSWEWTVANVERIRHEQQMPPLEGIAAKMIVSFLPPGGAPEHNSFANWNDIAMWYAALTQHRWDASDAIKQRVALLTAAQPTTLSKMQAIADFIQGDIRYVAIELGIGGWQPHTASEVFTTRYGDCKDKATLTISMLQAIGVNAYYVIINARRDAIRGDEPAHNGFNHAITAIQLPDGVQDPFLATIVHPKLGRLLFFDPTDEITPFGHIRGALQANYGLLVGPDGGELVELPRQDPGLTGIKRVAKLELDANGTLYGEVHEVRTGDRATEERWRLRDARTDSDKLKVIETLLSGSLGTFQITGSAFSNVGERNQPLGVNYALEAPGYGKNAGDMLLVRPRVLGSDSSGLLETDEPRNFPIEFEGPSRDSDLFEIKLPFGYEVADLPPPVDVDFGFASYHSKAELSGDTLRYVRAFEVKDVSVPAAKAAELKKLYRIVAADERNTAILRRRSQAAGAAPSAASPR